MDAGSLTCRVTIQERAAGKDAANQPIDGWTTVAQRWANISGQTGLGSITNMQDNVPASVERYSIRMRYTDIVKPEMRVLYQGQVFDVRQVRMDFARKEYTDLVCELGSRA